MRVKTPAMRLDLRIDKLELAADDQLMLKGVAGFLPCEALLTAPEVRLLFRQALRPRVLWWLIRGGR